MDIGCGYGYSTFLKQLVLEHKIKSKNLKVIPNVIGVDIYKSFIERANWMRKDVKTEISSPEFECINLIDENKPFWEGKFEFIHCGVAFS